MVRCIACFMYDNNNDNGDAGRHVRITCNFLPLIKFEFKPDCVSEILIIEQGLSPIIFILVKLSLDMRHWVG